MVLLGAPPPQNDLGLGKQRASAHADRKGLRVEVERATARDEVAGAWAGHRQCRLALAHLYQRAPKSLEGCAKLCLQASSFARRRQQQLLIRPEPQGGALAVDMRAASLLRQRESECPAGGFARGPPALQDEARRRREAPKPVVRVSHAGALPPGRRTRVGSP